MVVTVIIRFEPYNEEDIEWYFERLEMFLMANTVDKEKKVGHVMSGIGTTAYLVLQNLLALTNPKEQQFDNHKTNWFSIKSQTTSDWPAIHFSPTNTEIR